MKTTHDCMKCPYHRMMFYRTGGHIVFRMDPELFRYTLDEVWLHIHAGGCDICYGYIEILNYKAPEEGTMKKNWIIRVIKFFGALFS